MYAFPHKYLFKMTEMFGCISVCLEKWLILPKIKSGKKKDRDWLNNREKKIKLVFNNKMGDYE